MATLLQTPPLTNDSTMVDELTQLWNRAYRDLHLPPQLSLARRTCTPLSCIMADMDCLEGLNRRLGESVVNDTLRHTARLLAALCRAEDMLCYLGDGKFSLFLPATPQSGAARLANRVRLQIEFELRNSTPTPILATCSFGIADTRYGSDATLLDRADAALACAKRSGRNCISLSPPTLVNPPMTEASEKRSPTQAA